MKRHRSDPSDVGKESEDYQTGYHRGYAVGYQAGFKRIVPKEKSLTDFNRVIITNDGKYHESDEFICSNCGLHLEDWVGRDTDGSAYEFAFRFCPNCGGAVKDK